MSRETILSDRDGFVLTLTLNRPRQKNAFNGVMWGELGDCLREAREDPEVRLSNGTLQRLHWLARALTGDSF